AHALSPGIQRSAFCAGVERPLLPDRVLVRQEVRSNGHARFSASTAPTFALGGAQLTCCASVKLRPLDRRPSYQKTGAPFLRVLGARVGFHGGLTLGIFLRRESC